MVRPKFRYVCMEIKPVRKRRENEAFTDRELYKAFILMIKKLHGDYGLASIKTGFTCKYCNDVTNVALVKVRHGPHRFVTTAIPFITKIGARVVRLQTLRCTATLHQAYRFLKRYQQLELERLKFEIKNDDDKFSDRCLDLSKVEKLMITEPIILT